MLRKGQAGATTRVPLAAQSEYTAADSASMWMNAELQWTSQLVRLMSDPFLCCSPRGNLAAQAEAEKRPELHVAFDVNRFDAEPTKLIGTATSGSDTDSVHSGSDTDSETQAHATLEIEPAEDCAELKYLSNLLVSSSAGPHAAQELYVFAQSLGGRSACIELMTDRLMGDDQPPRRSLLPRSFVVVQELMGRLTLDAMRREASDELRALVDLSHAIVRAPLDECEECEMECQECDEEDDSWLTSRTTSGRASSTAATRGVRPAPPNAVQFVFEHEH